MTLKPNGAMRVSVIATVRNECDSIAPFLDSLLTQSHAPDEILIVDGASTDGTLVILQDYAARHGIRIISQSCNIAQGRNLGIAAATGTHIAVTDAGCRVDADWLQELISCFLDYPDAGVIAGNFRFETRTKFEEAVVLATFPPNRDETDGARYYPSSRSVAFTKEIWQKAGGYPEWLYAAEDTLFNIRLRQIGSQFKFCKTAIVYWRPRENWRALARQRINFSRGNARVGISTSGYIMNLRVHGLFVIFLAASMWMPFFILPAIATISWHIRQNLWTQAMISTGDKPMSLRLLVLAVMEFVRLVTLYGFILGRWDRLRDPNFIDRQQQYMNVSSVEELEASGII